MKGDWGSEQLPTNVDENPWDVPLEDGRTLAEVVAGEAEEEGE